MRIVKGILLSAALIVAAWAFFSWVDSASKAFFAERNPVKTTAEIEKEKFLLLRRLEVKEVEL